MPSKWLPEVLVVTDALPPLSGGGTAYTHNSIAGLPYRVLCVCPFKSASIKRSVRLKRVIYTNFQIRNKFLRKLYSLSLYFQFTVLPLIWACRYRRYLKAVVCFQLAPAGVAGYLIFLFFRIPYVVVTYGEELTQALKKKSFGRPVHRWLWALILSKADHITTISEFTRGVLNRFGVDGRRVRLIPPGIRGGDGAGPSEYLRSLLAERKLKQARLILMVGRLIARKGFDNAIRAFAEITDTVGSLHLLIVGTGEQGFFLKRLAESLTRPGEVVLLGNLKNEDINYLYSICEVFLLPVRTLENGDTEGFGMVFVEAGFHGKPVVAGRAGATPEAVLNGVTGIIVDGNSIDEIRDKVLQVLSDRALAARLGQAGRRRALKEFSIERQQELFNSLIRTVVQPTH